MLSFRVGARDNKYIDVCYTLICWRKDSQVSNVPGMYCTIPNSARGHVNLRFGYNFISVGP